MGEFADNARALTKTLTWHETRTGWCARAEWHDHLGRLRTRRVADLTRVSPQRYVVRMCIGDNREGFVQRPRKEAKVLVESLFALEEE